MGLSWNTVAKENKINLIKQSFRQTYVHGAIFSTCSEVHMIPLVEELGLDSPHWAVGAHVGLVEVPARGGEGLLRAALEVRPVSGVEQTKMALLANNVKAF